MNSMTGYAFEELVTETYTVSVEIKSVNSRFLDLTINLPSYLNQIEGYLHKKIADKVHRGKVDVFIRVKENETCTEVSVDVGAVNAYTKALWQANNVMSQSLDELRHLNSSNAQPIGNLLSTIIAQPGVLNVSRSYDIEKYKNMIDPVFDKAFDKFLADRKREGENMRIDLEEKLSKLEECAAFFKEWQPKMETIFREQITTRFKELLENNVDENRIMTETAAMLIKYTINEEIVRLHSHISAMKAEMAENPIPGKKIDFICQEMNREINTIGSKNQFAEVGAKVIAAKDSLENIREQAKNVE